jgi:hypothetical protein
MNKIDEWGWGIDSPEKMSYIVLYCLTVLRLNLSGPSDMDIIRKAQSRRKTRVSQTSASKLNKAMCHFPDDSGTCGALGYFRFQRLFLPQSADLPRTTTAAALALSVR